jgi:hypothetical protein
MDADTQTFCGMVRNRSAENRRAMACFTRPHEAMSPAFSILRQELDSMVRVIFLLKVKNITERRRLINATLRGEQWKVPTAKGKHRAVTDREMVNLAQQLQGWTQSVYRFGCAFVHLSNFHNHFTQNPFERLGNGEKEHVLAHMRHHHGGPSNDNPDMRELAGYLPEVFKKIADNLECYLKELERDQQLGE